jgi:hypothetical protein
MNKLKRFLITILSLLCVYSVNTVSKADSPATQCQLPQAVINRAANDVSWYIQNFVKLFPSSYPVRTSYGCNWICNSGSNCNASGSVTVNGQVKSITMNYVGTTSDVQSIDLRITVNVSTGGTINYSDPILCSSQSGTPYYVGSIVIDIYMPTSVIQPGDNTTAYIGLGFTSIAVNDYTSHFSFTGNPTVDNLILPSIESALKNAISNQIQNNLYAGNDFIGELEGLFNTGYSGWCGPNNCNTVYAPIYPVANVTGRGVSLQSGQTGSISINVANASTREETFYNPDYMLLVTGLDKLGGYASITYFNIINPSTDLISYLAPLQQTALTIPITAPVNECDVDYPVYAMTTYDNTPGDHACPLLVSSPGVLEGFIVLDVHVAGTYPQACIHCAATAAMEGTSLEGDIPVIRKFRDNVLSTGYEGKVLTALYYENSPEVVEIMMEHPELLSQARTLLETYLPAIKALVNNGELPPGLADKVLTKDEINNITDFVDLIHQYAGPQLRIALEQVRTLLLQYAELPLGLGIKILIHGSPMPASSQGKAIGIYNRLP